MEAESPINTAITVEAERVSSQAEPSTQRRPNRDAGSRSLERANS